MERAALWHEVKVGLPPPFIAAHPLHRSFRVAYPLIDASTADVKTVKVTRIALQNMLSSNHTAYCLHIELSEQTDPLCLRIKRHSYITLLASYRPQKFLYGLIPQLL